jgi:protein TonB
MLPPTREAVARGRPPGSRRRPSLRWLLAVSALLHLAVLLLVLYSQPQPVLEQKAGEPTGVDVVMLPPPEAEAPPAAEATPSQPATPAPRAPPSVRLALPVPPPPPPVPEAEALPLPPPPRPPTPRPPVPSAAPFPRPIARSFADFGLGSPGAAPSRPEHGRGIDLALGPVARASNGAVPRNPDSAQGMVRIEGADLGSDWLAALHEWWNRHGYYPRQAAMQGEDGTTRVRLLVDRSGRVREAELEMRSGSQWLDMGSLAIFRDAMLPPFPPSTPQNQVTLHLTLDFILLHARGG